MIEHIESSFVTAQATLEAFSNDSQSLEAVAHAAQLLISSLERGGRAFSCGNGLVCDAMHFAEEFTGRFLLDRPGMAAVAISDPIYIFCVANDSDMNRFLGDYSNRTDGLAPYCWRSAPAGKARSSPTPRTPRATSAHDRPIRMPSSPTSTPWPVELLQRVWSATSGHLAGC